MVNKGDDMKALMSPNSLYQEAYNAICELVLIKGIIGDNYDILRLKELVEADKLIGKTVYKIERWCDGTKGDCGSFVDCKDCDDYELKVYECSILGLDDAMKAIKNMGKTVFATYNEAEAKLYKTEK